METIVAAAVTALPPTIAALAAWRNAKAASHNTNGALHGPLARIEARLDELTVWTVNHDRRHLEERRGMGSELR